MRCHWMAILVSNTRVSFLSIAHVLIENRSFAVLHGNFAKFLADKNGVPVRRYPPNRNPLSLAQDIEAFLQ